MLAPPHVGGLRTDWPPAPAAALALLHLRKGAEKKMSRDEHKNEARR
jgi:hypothetical protein